MEYADLDVQEPSALGAARGVGKYLRLSADVAVLAHQNPRLRIQSAARGHEARNPGEWPERCLFLSSASTSFGDDHRLPRAGICPGAVMLHIEDRYCDLYCKAPSKRSGTVHHMCGVGVPMSSAFRPFPQVGTLSSATLLAQGTQVQQGTEAQTEHMCMQTVEIDECWDTTTREASLEPHRQRHIDC